MDLIFLKVFPYFFKRRIMYSLFVQRIQKTLLTAQRETPNLSFSKEGGQEFLLLPSKGQPKIQ